MDLVTAEPQSSQKPHNFSNFLGKSYAIALNQSIQALLESLKKPGSNFSMFKSTFQELLQSTVNPPLETIWVYSALNFLNPNSLKDNPFDRFAATKSLFQTIAAYSASCNPWKSILLLAPVIYNVCKVVIDLKGNESGSKREQKLMKEIKGLVDVILGHINVCCDGLNCANVGIGDSGLESDGLVMSLEDLVCVWIGDKVVKSEGSADEGLRLFFPLLGDEILRWLTGGDYGTSELAGVVIGEAFLLKLCLEFHEQSHNELRSWAIGSISGLENIFFFETLVRTLLGPTLPGMCLLNSEDETYLRKVLYDATILVDYSFLNSENLAHLTGERVKSIALARLVVTHKAVEIFREHNDLKKVISFTNAFSSSHLTNQLIKLVTREIGMGGKTSGPNGSSPKAFLKWLFDLENQGIKIFENSMSKCCAKLVFDDAKEDYKQAGYMESGQKSDTDLLFYIDNKGEVEEVNEEEDGNVNESLSAAFVAAAHTMKTSKHVEERGRKEGSVKKRKRVKFFKYNLYDYSESPGELSKVSRRDNSSSEGEDNSSIEGEVDDLLTDRKDNSSSGSEVDDPLTDDDIEVKNQ